MNTLKKIFAALFVLLMAAGVAEAKPIAFGIKAGLNVNSLKFNKDIASSDNSCGWTAGVMADFTVPIIGLGCDVSLMYARMNNSSDVTYNTINNPNSGVLGDGTMTDGTLNNNSLYGQNFLEIPINLKYKFTLPVVSNFLKPYLFTGPNFAFRLGKSLKDNVQNLKSRTCQVAWNVGLGVELVNHVQIGASYGFGINNVVERITDEVNTADFKAKNNYWTVTAAYLF
ncbi:MAG: porin family protein [Bacteroides sp.]|nr:porin family protein [Bacteroides sp.]MDE6235399.1 PorT family protein [Muribaculaceae bacterium]